MTMATYLVDPKTGQRTLVRRTMPEGYQPAPETDEGAEEASQIGEQTDYPEETEDTPR